MKRKILFGVFFALVTAVMAMTIVSAGEHCCGHDYDSLDMKRASLLDGYTYEDSMDLDVMYSYREQGSICDCIDFDSLETTKTGLLDLDSYDVYYSSLVQQDLSCVECLRSRASDYGMHKNAVIRCTVTSD